MTQFLNVRHLAMLMVMVGLTGCTSRIELYSNLKQDHANKMMAILQDESIDVEKVAGEENTWTLTVPTSDVSRAMKTLNALGYPKEDRVSMAELFKQNGLVSSPKEQRIRYIHGKEQSVAETISLMDGVLSARVLISDPEQDPYGRDKTKENVTASVYIKYRHDTNLDTKLPQITQLVADSVDELEYDHVTIMQERAEDPAKVDLAMPEARYTEALSIRLAPESVNRFWTVLGGISAVATINLLLMIGTFLYRRPAKAVPVSA